jgi:A/G-specific adenine glycosylase
MARRRSRAKRSGRAESQTARNPRAAATEAEPAWVERIQATLLAWYEHDHRDLPWRADRDPYRILVSEMMLVQTTVAAVIPYFERFLARFPTLEALAAADQADALKAWEGLGYYRRARQLHAAARAIVEKHGGHVPRELSELEALPGIGRYIAGAVASIAFDKAVPILEANTQRVLARLIACSEDMGRTDTQRRLWEASHRLVPASHAGTFNQALMELGATVCLPRNPLCFVCPLAPFCQARRQGLQDRLPIRAKRPVRRTSREIGILAVRDGRILMARRRTGQLWEDFWEIPTVHAEGADPAGRVRLDAHDSDLAAALRQATGLRIELGPPLGEFRYSVTSHSVTLQVLEALEVEGPVHPGPGYTELRWLEREEIGGLTRSAVNRRLLARLVPNESTSETAGPPSRASRRRRAHLK